MNPGRLLIISLAILASGACYAADQDKGNVPETEYKISVGEILEISVYDEPDLNKTVRVSPEGTINYPLIGEIQVAGLNPKELEKKMKALLSPDYLINPEVSVFIKEYSKVFVLGQVQKPGAYEMRSGLTAVDAIALAGGFTKHASADNTKVIRKRDGSKQAIIVPVGSILKSGDKSKDVTLKPNDTVAVPESFF